MNTMSFLFSTAALHGLRVYLEDFIHRAQAIVYCVSTCATVRLCFWKSAHVQLDFSNVNIRMHDLSDWACLSKKQSATCTLSLGIPTQLPQLSRREDIYRHVHGTQTCPYDMCDMCSSIQHDRDLSSWDIGTVPDIFTYFNILQYSICFCSFPVWWSKWCTTDITQVKTKTFLTTLEPEGQKDAYLPYPAYTGMQR